MKIKVDNWTDTTPKEAGYYPIKYKRGGTSVVEVLPSRDDTFYIWHMGDPKPERVVWMQYQWGPKIEIEDLLDSASSNVD